MTSLRKSLFLCSIAWFAAGGLHAANVLANGSFENGVAPWRAGLGPPLETWHVQHDQAPDGTACLRFKCDGTLASADYPEMQFGRQLSRLGTYQLSAKIRNDGVTQGNFGLRLYFHDQNGQFLAMGGGISVDSNTRKHDWKTYQTRFGRGTGQPVPPGTSRLMIRFSFWDPEGNCHGDVWLDDVVLEQTADATRREDAPPTAILWHDPAIEAITGPGVGGAAALLSNSDFAPRRLTTDELVEDGVLDIAAVDAVVLPYGSWYPAGLTSALVTYAAEGGVIVALGPRPLTSPLYRTAEGWYPRTAATEQGERLAIPLARRLGLGHASPDDALVPAPLQDENGVRIAIQDLQAYAYIGTELPSPAPDDAVLSFEARGDRNTPRLCLEFKEEDTSRWKAMVALRPEWQSYRIHLGEFISYANEKIGRAESTIRPAEVRSFMMGFTAAMVGKGPHAFDVRNLTVEAAAVPTEAVAATPAFVPPERNTASWFGKYAIPGKRVLLPAALQSGKAWQGDKARVAQHPLLPQTDLLRRDLIGVVVDPAAEPRLEAAAPRERLAEGIRNAGAMDRIVLLESAGLFDDHLPLGVLIFQRAGRFAGSRWIHIGLQNIDFATQEPLAEVVNAALKLACSSVYVDALRPRFRADNGRIVLDVTLLARNLSSRETGLSLNTRVRSGDLGVVYENTAEVSMQGLAGAATTYELASAIPADSLNWQDFEIVVEAVDGGVPLLGQTRFAFNAVESLRDMCDIMVREGADDGTFLGTSFVDNRGARALLGAYEIIGKRAYRKAAFDWADVMLEEQRDDGGYRMGYGISSKGEACYVADGGEIAVAIARMISYAKGGRREALMESLDAYMDYREAFRVPSGGIGVGWCLQDYGQRPTVPLDKPTRIFAPEKNTYTIGCTLAAAYAHAAIRQQPDLMRRAAADADWLMSRTRALNGAFIESYIYAHYLTPSEERRKTYKQFIEETFSARMRRAGTQEESWWLSGEGRTALNLGGLAYVLDEIGDDPILRAEMMRASCLMFSHDSHESVFAALSKTDAKAGKWIYACFGSLGLVDVIQPLVSMEDLVPEQ